MTPREDRSGLPGRSLFHFSSVALAPAQGPAGGPVADAMRNRQRGPGLLRAASPCSSQGHPSGAVWKGGASRNRPV
jgi:hypothetical protein